jgi:hypothetical protein
MMFTVFLIGILVSYVNAFVAVAASPDWGNIKHVRTLLDYREATVQDCVIMFLLDGHERCRAMEPAFCEIAERTDKHKFYLAHMQHEPVRRISQVMEIEILPTVVIYKKEDVYTIPCSAALLSALPTILEET